MVCVSGTFSTRSGCTKSTQGTQSSKQRMLSRRRRLVVVSCHFAHVFLSKRAAKPAPAPNVDVPAGPRAIRNLANSLPPRLSRLSAVKSWFWVKLTGVRPAPGSVFGHIREARDVLYDFFFSDWRAGPRETAMRERESGAVRGNEQARSHDARLAGYSWSGWLVSEYEFAGYRLVLVLLLRSQIAGEKRLSLTLIVTSHCACHLSSAVSSCWLLVSSRAKFRPCLARLTTRCITAPTPTHID